MALLILALIGLFAGLLGGLLGIGGSVLIIPGMILYLSVAGEYRGDQQHLIQAAAMICNLFVAAPAAVAHWRLRAIMPSVIAWLAPSAVVGIVFGVWLSNSSAFARENGVYLAMLFAGFLMYVVVYNAWRLVDKSNFAAEFDDKIRLAPWKMISVGVPMGVGAGLLGIGGGAICVPLQQTVLRIPLRRAIANSAATIVLISTLGAAQKNLTLSEHGFALADSVGLAAMLVPTAILGSYAGGLLTHRLPRKVLRLIFIVFMLTVAVLTFREAWTARRSRPISDYRSPNPDRALCTRGRVPRLVASRANTFTSPADAGPPLIGCSWRSLSGQYGRDGGRSSLPNQSNRPAEAFPGRGEV